MIKSLVDIKSNQYFTITKDQDVKEVMKSLVQTVTDETMIDDIYVVDHKNKLLGVVPLKELIIARSPYKIEDLMNKKYPFLVEDTDIIESIDMIQKYDINQLPIVSKNHTMMGIITAEDALDLLKEESLEDYRKMSSLNDYNKDAKAKERSKKRLPWLIILLGLSLITASILSYFEHTIEAVVLLIFFQPMILDSAGNISTQSLAKTILLINHEPDAKLGHHIKNELLIGAVNSLFSAIIGFIIVYLFLVFFVNNEPRNIEISLVIALTLFISLLIGAATGAFIPVILQKLGIDPSVASGPFMTTLNDVFSLVIYFTLATMFLI